MWKRAKKRAKPDTTRMPFALILIDNLNFVEIEGFLGLGFEL